MLPSKRQLWLWGDRLLDGKLTGLGEWEASRIDTQPAADLIPKDAVICDWHYTRADQTAVYFAMKGLDVVSCSWKNPVAAAAQVKDMVRFRESSTPQMKQHFQGVAQSGGNIGPGKLWMREKHERRTGSHPHRNDAVRMQRCHHV